MNPKMKDRLAKAVTSLHVALYKAGGGRFVGRTGKAPMLLLTTTGRRSGKARTTPLVYLADGDRKVLVASYGGDDRSPAWFHNLVANPDVTVQAGRETQRMRAAVASPDEKAVLWPKVVDLYKGYANYQRRTTRDIPLVILTPA